MKSLSVCVFCGSRSGGKPEYELAARTLGNGIGQRKWRLVYGAGDVGLMGSVAISTQAQGSETFGVIPTHLIHKEVAKRDLTQFIVTDDMHERKKVMFMNSDAIVLLPGGAGSLDEFFEVLTWAQLDLHEKPLLLVNVANYWSPLISLIDHVILEGFAEKSLKNLFKVVDSAEDALATIQTRLA